MARGYELRPKPGTILSDEPGHHKTVVTRVVENDERLMVHTTTTYFYTYTDFKTQKKRVPEPSKRTITHAKYLCVNGPLVGQTRVAEEAPGYIPYNRSGHIPYSTSPSVAGNKNIPSVVLVHSSTL